MTREAKQARRRAALVFLVFVVGVFGAGALAGALFAG